jgi:hypothetical protein
VTLFLCIVLLAGVYAIAGLFCAVMLAQRRWLPVVLVAIGAVAGGVYLGLAFEAPAPNAPAYITVTLSHDWPMSLLMIANFLVLARIVALASKWRSRRDVARGELRAAPGKDVIIRRGE